MSKSHRPINVSNYNFTTDPYCKRPVGNYTTCKTDKQVVFPTLILAQSKFYRRCSEVSAKFRAMET